MGKYAEYVKEFLEEYDEPELREYIVGFSGITPDKKVKACEIEHDELAGVHGGDISGKYHLTREQVNEFTGYRDEISQLRTDAFAESKRIETKASGDISRLRTDTTAEIGRVESKEDTAIAKLRTDTTAEIGRVERETDNKITAASDNADTKINTLRTDALVEAKRIEDKATVEISTLRTDTFTETKRIEEKAESDISQLSAETSSEIERVERKIRTDIASSELRTDGKIADAELRMSAKADWAETEARRALSEVSQAQEEFVSGIREVKGDQSELERKEGALESRFDEVISGVTEDGEILDARVDTDGESHVTLGHNLRSIQDELRQGISEARTDAQSMYEKAREQSDNLADAVTATGMRLNDATTELRGDISTAREETRAVYNYAQEQANYLAGELLRRNIADRERDKGLQGLLKEWTAAREHISEQLGELAGGIIQTGLDVKDAVSEITRDEQARHSQIYEELSLVKESTDSNAYTLMDLAIQLSQRTTGAALINNPLDWSKSKSLAIPEPRCAVVNITGINAVPASKTADQPAVMEFWDKAGNYFRKAIICNAQGQTSLMFPKKNMKFDLLNSDGSEFELKIGDWVIQDSYHLKAYYTDYFRGVGVVGYKLMDEIMRTRGTNSDRPWKVGLGVTDGVTPTGGTQKGADIQLDTGALCHPDGFPCLLYLNGNFYGIYAWQLKKHRKNYHMEKGNAGHIHLDGNTTYFRDDAVAWTGFEVRNPSKLYTMDGRKYDGDSPTELIDESSANYDAGNKDHVRSAEVKASILRVVSRFKEVKRLCNEYKGAPTEAKLSAARQAYEEIFDPCNEIDYLIFSDVTYNEDGFDHNVQMMTYDGVKWYSNAYDLDQIFGGSWLGESLYPPQTRSVLYTWRGNNTFGPSHCLPIIYNTELEARYKELRDAGIIGTEHILSYLKDWVSRIGTESYALEYEKWPDSPCIKNYTDSIYRVKKWLDEQIANMDAVYNYESERTRLERLEEYVYTGEYSGSDTSEDGEYDDPEFDAMIDEVFGVNP